MSKKYSDQELFIIRNQKFTEFTEEDLTMLKNGEATIRQTYAADKCLEKHHAFLSKPISRKDAFNSFVPGSIFIRETSQIKNNLAFLSRTLVDKGIITPEELDKTSHVMIAETWDHLCDKCLKEFPGCSGEPKFGKDIYPDIENSLADKVVTCEKYEEPKQEGTA
jgi:hypothetical protein